jgi:hypothetical protein
LRDYLRSWGYSSQKAVKVAYQRDLKKVEQWTNVTIKGLRDSAEKHNAVIFFGDESSVQTESFNGKSFKTAWLLDRRQAVLTKYVNNFQRRLGLDKIIVLSSERMENRTLILFIATIFISYIHQQLQNNNIHNHNAMLKIFNALRSLKMITINERTFYEPLTQEINKIFSMFNIIKHEI